MNSYQRQAGRPTANTASRPWFFVLCLFCLTSPLSYAQDPPPDDLLGDFEIEETTLPLCFGLRDITEERALEICDALYLRDNVRARELAEAWIRSQPDHPGAQFALAEVLFNVEANLPRALFHLKRAEELTDYPSLGRAIASGFLEWHYLTLSQLSYVYQLMGDQIASLEYLAKLEEVYGQETESFRGWPLIKLKQYDAARASANLVLQDSDNPRDRARAWNTICAADLASLRPREDLRACDRAIDEDENIANAENDTDTVYLVNASEVSLSLLKIDEAEHFLDRAGRYPNPDSVADPWVYKLYLTMNQGRFDDARQALDRMLLWRENQIPVVGVMNRAEHLLASAMFMMLAGNGQEAARLSMAALNEPDRNGSFSADDEQKDSMAALLHMMASHTAIESAREHLATLPLVESFGTRLRIATLQLSAWRSGRRAAALFADRELMLNRFRPYAPLDVHIPEWVEPELVSMLGTGVSRQILEEARRGGAFMLNEGYYHAYGAEIAYLDQDWRAVLESGNQALAQLPPQEVLLQARLHARMGDAAFRLRETALAIEHFETAVTQDPGVIRRLGASLPVVINRDDSEVAREVESMLRNSPRFKRESAGLRLEIQTQPELTVCLYGSETAPLSCYSQTPGGEPEQLAALLVTGFHTAVFSLDYEISDAEIALLMGSTVIMSSQRTQGMNPDSLFR